MKVQAPRRRSRSASDEDPDAERSAIDLVVMGTHGLHRHRARTARISRRGDRAPAPCAVLVAAATGATSAHASLRRLLFLIAAVVIPR
jgi:hypothetical protein